MFKERDISQQQLNMVDYKIHQSARQLVQEELEGELNRKKSFWSSSKDLYKLSQTSLLIKKGNQWKVKYDLQLYNVRLSKKENCIFYLEPLEDTLKLPRIEFQTKSPEERAKWFLALTRSIKENELLQQQFLTQKSLQSSMLLKSMPQLIVDQSQENHPKLAGSSLKYVDSGSGLTLTEITEYLLSQDTELESTITKSQRAFANLQCQMTELQTHIKGKKKEKITQILETGKEFVTQHENSMIQIRKIKRQLFELCEQIAAKEQEQNPAQYFMRESQKSRTKVEPILFADQDQSTQLQFDKTLALPEEASFDDNSSEYGRFQDPVEQLIRRSYKRNTNSARSSSESSSDASQQDENGEPLERDELPWLKDPNTKISLWAIIKDNIGKDLSKVSVPVYLNDPSSTLQKIAQSWEYSEILDLASVEEDPMRRIALVATFMVTQQTVAEKSVGKPFNPMLFETFEMKTDKFEFLAEQVSHHPPVAAVYVRGKQYTYFNNSKPNISFTGKMLKINQQYRSYIHFDQFDETYELIPPTFSIHNLVIGQLYVDIGESLLVINQNRPNERCEVRFERRGWFSDDAFKCEGEAFKVEGKSKNISLGIKGKWNESVTLTNLETKQSEVMWTKKPYPEKVAWMYGMSHYHLQLNYFPKRLQNVVAPTDTRRRPDQRALENGDMSTAAVEKDRLENRQRAFRKYNETSGIEPQPAYFQKWHNPSDDQIYWRYNGKYFEQDRKKQDWSRSHDIFGSEYPDEVKPFIVK